jgi:hypothetical protein
VPISCKRKIIRGGGRGKRRRERGKREEEREEERSAPTRIQLAHCVPRMPISSRKIIRGGEEEGRKRKDRRKEGEERRGEERRGEKREARIPPLLACGLRTAWLISFEKKDYFMVFL